jgi:hypothetical protein
MSIFLITFLSCSQVQATINRLQNIAILSSEQKTEIVQELRKVAPTCPIIIKNDDRSTKTRN